MLLYFNIKYVKITCPGYQETESRRWGFGQTSCSLLTIVWLESQFNSFRRVEDSKQTDFVGVFLVPSRSRTPPVDVCWNSQFLLAHIAALSLLNDMSRCDSGSSRFPRASQHSNRPSTLKTKLLLCLESPRLSIWDVLRSITQKQMKLRWKTWLKGLL